MRRSMLRRNEVNMNSGQENTCKNMTCICCPIGCELRVELFGDATVKVSGNKCPRGAAYGEKELTNPTRTVTSTVRIAGNRNAVVAVKTATDIPKDKIGECMKALAAVEVHTPVQVGDIVLENVADTGVNIVITRKA